MRLTGHPGGWPGHVVDHIIPLACGGPDTPENMQWQTRGGEGEGSGRATGLLAFAADAIRTAAGQLSGQSSNGPVIPSMPDS